MTVVMKLDTHLPSGTAPKKKRKKAALHLFSSVWLLVVYTLWYASSAVFCSSRLMRRFPSGPASSAAGCGYGRKTWSPSSLAGCSPAEGRVRGSARSLPWRGLVAPWGFSLGESPLLHARPPTRGASAHRASLRDCKEEVWQSVKKMGENNQIYRVMSEAWLPDLGGMHLLLWTLAIVGVTGGGMGALFFRGGRPGPFFFTITSAFSLTSSFSSSASESEKESAELPDITVGQRWNGGLLTKNVSYLLCFTS